MKIDKDNDYGAITGKSYWDSGYQGAAEYIERDFENFREFCNKQILEKITRYYPGGDLLEIGAGGSDWIIDLTRLLQVRRSVGIDYSEPGCKLLAAKSDQAGVDVEVIHADMFSPPAGLLGRFDFVVSFGVVEHFQHLPDVMKAISNYAKPGGVVFTLIPNLHGLNGWLTRLWNKRVYDIHVVHDLTSFVEGSRSAGLEILWADYLGAINLSVLAACFPEKRGFAFWVYKQLTRLSKLVWIIERCFKRLPSSRLFSPYIVVISRV